MHVPDQIQLILASQTDTMALERAIALLSHLVERSGSALDGPQVLPAKALEEKLNGALDGLLGD